jgi:hypothetical protein
MNATLATVDVRCRHLYQCDISDKLRYDRQHCGRQHYTTTPINHRLSIYTYMNPSLLFLKLSRAHAQFFRHPV